VGGILLVSADQVIKFILVQNNWDIFRNYHFAFSLPLPQPVMYGIYASIEILIIGYLLKNRSRLASRELWAWTLILAGSLSNIGERIILGYVRDFIPILSGIFNLADFYIIVGLIILVVSSKNPNLVKTEQKL
jgi:lipoprotein signal peptidase